MILTGLCRLGRDAELRYLPDGTAVLSLALAYNWGKKDGQGNRASQWVDASLFGDRATTLQPYLTKGQQINAYIDDIHTEQFKRKDNTVGIALRGRITSLEFAGSNASKQPTGQSTTAQAASKAHDDDDDDIPF